MLTYTYVSKGTFGLVDKPKPTIQHERDAIVKVTLAYNRSFVPYARVRAGNTYRIF